tara:strand:+ start:1556 stop:2125 length:570 start_codon:yes stop_codon:yes gene_type:complete
MNKKSIGIILLLILIAIFSIFFFSNSPVIKDNKIEDEKLEETSKMSNIIENVEYSSKDTNGNEYIIKASEGETDIINTNIIFLKNVNAIIKLKNSNKILIFADFGKYNIDNFDTIFSKNVIINYLEKKITSDYMDFSVVRNSMIISKNVLYTDNENTLRTDVVEIDIENKNTKFFMYDKNKKVRLKSKY